MLNQNYKESLINSINVFCKNINCSSCGGSYNFQTFTCEYCGSFNEELKRSYDSIVSIISSLNENDIDEELSLYLLDLSMNTKVFGELLNRLNFTAKVDEVLQRLSASPSYNEEDVKLIEIIFNRDSFSYIDTELRNKIIKDVLLKKNTLSKELIEKVLSHLVLGSANVLNMKINFFVANLGDKTGGDFALDKVRLNKTCFDAFYNNGSSFSLYILFHELYHAYKLYCNANGIINNYIDIMSIKETILVNFYNHSLYTGSNYNKNLEEILANVYSYNNTKKYLSFLGFEVDESYAQLCSGIVNNDLESLSDPLRKIDDKFVNINDLFAEFIYDRPDLFELYPGLRYEFKVEEGHVVYKGKMELVDELIFQNDNAKLDELYLTLIKNANDRENTKYMGDTKAS